MATLKKRGSKYVVVYTDPDRTTKSKQVWESFDDEKEAKLRKAEIEYLQAQKSSVKMSNVTVRQLLHDFVEIYGSSKWVMSTYSSNKALIDNYINPHIGDVDLALVTSKFVDKFYRELQKVKYIPTAQKTRNTGKTLAPSMLCSIHKIMRCAFNQAVRWEHIAINPFEKAILPDYHPDEKKIWRSAEITKALSACDDIRLEIAINLAFACSMRAWEITGLQWVNVHVSEKSIAEDDSWLYVDKELSRVNTEALKAVRDKDIILRIPKILPGRNSELVLKAPKTRSSIRKIWIPRTVALLLLEHQQNQMEHIKKLKDEWGEDYLDYDLVLAEDSGRPWQNYRKHFEKLRERCNLPEVDFHSLRHSSTTYKLKMSNGDIKAVQGDTGHAEVEMVTKQYAHILDEDRKINATRFEQEFYQGGKSKPKWSIEPDEQKEMLMEMLTQNPQLAHELMAMLIGAPKA